VITESEQYIINPVNNIKQGYQNESNSIWT